MFSVYVYITAFKWVLQVGLCCWGVSSRSWFRKPGSPPPLFFFFSRVSEQGPCLIAIEENGGDKRHVDLELACEDGWRGSCLRCPRTNIKESTAGVREAVTLDGVLYNDPVNRDSRSKLVSFLHCGIKWVVVRHNT